MHVIAFNTEPYFKGAMFEAIITDFAPFANRRIVAPFSQAPLGTFIARKSLKKEISFVCRSHSRISSPPKYNSCAESLEIRLRQQNHNP